jgi:hypothetical protein
MRSPALKRGRTDERPERKASFSSRDFVAKVERSRKLRVLMGRELKKGWEGRVAGEGRAWGCRVMSWRRRAGDVY